MRYREIALHSYHLRAKADSSICCKHSLMIISGGFYPNRVCYMKLYTIVYVSIATNPMLDDDLLKLLEKAREYNKANAITGMLLYRDGFFIQALEGQETSINALFDKIKNDPRHYNVLVIHKTQIDFSTFSQWSMGFETPSFDSLKQRKGFTDFMQAKDLDKFDGTDIDFENEVLELLDMFRR